ncbi:DNA recombination and repair protein RecO [Roseibacterium elongatum DSM 19469]|uniref:DNA repair protein RecO n=1 Tax=Roseicyclus elongatus DSM 19469 TaxID=1294273 RepID=W8RRT8_9RHOB|nr:DNA repair protein RecO [Roseibacterium elongatum]AHM03889.1 DNA recombination and repair protein RecO [Roseibacterium elongatum DSM 19469]
MEWRADGILLTMRRHGETAAILEMFTKAQGRHLGVVPGGASRRLAPHLQPGAQLDVTWRARLSDHLGSFKVEPIAARAPEVMGDRVALAGLGAVCALLSFCLPEREAHPALYARSKALLDGLGAARWPEAYLGWERALLDETGFGLALDACAVTGTNEDLAFISPRTGRAVSRQGAGDWADRLLPFPACLSGAPASGPDEVLAGLTTTGHFLAHHLAPSLGEKPLPPARQRFVDLLARQANGSARG